MYVCSVIMLSMSLSLLFLSVGVSLTVENIESVSSEEMDMTLTFVLKQVWIDKRLAHNGIGKVHVPSKIIEDIWIPDIIIQNAKTTSLHSTLTDNFMMKVGPNGEMEYSIKMSATIICQMQLTNFPMDRQLCSLSLYRMVYGHFGVIFSHFKSVLWQVASIRNNFRVTLQNHSVLIRILWKRLGFILELESEFVQ